ncbi:SRPBCC domain-containing protein [Streptomyces yaanensis]|uniref:SRPBCC domain-containing protein n=1 Tax=Streptomyces yaanensis TaxID=1142239 RepID=A0ABV7SDW5_9ACTN|nr:SRPBCC domain-containing protein [Streptomyces sp. CGMCC 4.7035]WNB99333.1 SRPBCC domain-containing protein [Streptomyces sp. CGMCC 4.7035]
MRRISSTVHISAPTDQVWAVLSDFERFHEWNPFLVEAAGRAAPGARLTLRFRLPGNGREMVFRPTVLHSEPGRLLCWRGRLGVPGIFDGVHSFELTERDGGTQVLQSECFSGLLVPFSGAVITPSEKGFQDLTDALKKRVESVTALQGEL